MTIDPIAVDVERLELVRDTAQRVLAREWDPARSRELLEQPAPCWSDALWRQLTELGWGDLLITGTVRELCAVAELVGAATAVTPLVHAAVAQWCGRRASLATQLIVYCEALSLRAKATGETLAVSGTLEHVAFGDVADSLLVLVAVDNDDGAALVRLDLDAPGVRRTSLQPLDHSPTARVECEAVVVPASDVVATGAAADALAADAEQRLLLGLISELTGVAAGANDRAVEYAKVREAFGRPIGTFQAIKHRLVDQRCAIEVARALVARAATAVDTRAVDASALTALAAFWAVANLRAVPEGALQVFGGIGYTWEHDAHIALRRAAVLTARLGPRADHRAVVGDWLAAGYQPV